MSAPANGHSASADSSAQTSKVQPSDVGWQFVPQYYNFVNKQPHRLHCFYNKRSTFIHGEEGDDAQPALGQAEIHERINAIGYDQCKVYIHSIDSQSSANGGIIILVIGEMSNKNQPWRKFTQTFFLAEQPNGYFVLNDIFRYLKEEVEEDEDEYDPSEQEAAVEVPEEAPSVPEEAVVPVPPTEAPTPVPEPVEAAPEPEPTPSSSTQPDAEAVPTEAVVASVPDEDVAPSEPATAVEEPVTSAPPAPTPAKAAEAKAPAASETAPTPAAPAAPTPAPAAAPAKPKTWASLAASNAGKPWGSASAPAPAAAPAPAPAAPAPKKEEPAQPAQNLENKHPYYVNASRVNINHCFVKLPNWSPDGSAGAETVDPEAIKKAASRFGEVVSVETVKNKACAFVEFAKVEGARRAIIASLTVAQGGEGGVKLESGGKLNFEVRKDKEERGKKAGSGGRQSQDGQRGPRPQQNSERGGSAPNRGRGRGRGGAPAGDRQQK